MMTIREMIAETYEAMSDLDISKTDLQVLHSIETLIKELNGEMFSGKSFEMYDARELSRICGSLAIWKASLGDILVRASKNAKLSEARLSFARASHRREVIEELTALKNGKNPTVDDVNSELELKTTKRRYIAIFREEYSDRCLYLWRSVNSIMDAINQRVRVLMSDRSDVKYYDTTLGFDAGSIPDFSESKIAESIVDNVEPSNLVDEPFSDSATREDQEKIAHKKIKDAISEADFSDLKA